MNIFQVTKPISPIQSDIEKKGNAVYSSIFVPLLFRFPQTGPHCLPLMGV